MSQAIHNRLKELGIVLPEPSSPAANYVPFVQAGTMLYISGQLPMANGVIMKGRLGQGAAIEQGQEAAKLCAAIRSCFSKDSALPME